MSLWTAGWILGQIGPPETRLSPLGVPGEVLAFFGLDVAQAVQTAGDFLAEPERRTVLLLCAWGAGVLWAATTERSQFPALLGWSSVMIAAEGLGYHEAVYRAILGMVGLIALLFLCSLPLRRVPVCRRARLLPRDVLSTGFTAAALSAVVPLLAVGLLVTRVCSPYLTRPPQILGPVRTPIRPEESTVAAPSADPEPTPGGEPDAPGAAVRADRPAPEDASIPEIAIPDQPGADHDRPAAARPLRPAE